VNLVREADLAKELNVSRPKLAAIRKGQFTPEEAGQRGPYGPILYTPEAVEKLRNFLKLPEPLKPIHKNGKVKLEILTVKRARLHNLQMIEVILPNGQTAWCRVTSNADLKPGMKVQAHPPAAAGHPWFQYGRLPKQIARGSR